MKMTWFPTKHILFVLISISMVAGLPPKIVQAQTLLEMIFQNAHRRRLARQPKPAPQPIKKVSAPKYFGYKTPALKKVNFAPLMALLAAQEATSSAALDTGTADTLEVDAGSTDNRATGSLVSTATNDAQDTTAIAAVVEEGITTEINPETSKQEFISGFSELSNFQIMAAKNIAKAVVDHYAENPNYVWIDGNQVSSKANSALRIMAAAEDYGLDPLDYSVALLPDEAGEDQLMQFEIAMSLRAVRYVLDARIGKINPNKLSGYHDFPKPKINAADVMVELATQISPAAYLVRSHPNNAPFQAMKAELQHLKTISSEVIRIADGTLIKPGQSHEELPNVIASIRKKSSLELRQRFGEVLTAYSRTTEYTDDLVALVKAFQKEAKLKPDGVVGRNTISKMVDVHPDVKINRVKMAMERLRWHPHQLGQRHVFVNQPAYRARYIEGGEEKLSMRVIVGKRSNQTSFFHDIIERVEYNPYWGVPQSIIINEMLPKLRADPSYLDARGYEVSRVGGGNVSSSSVDWHSVGGGVVPYNVRQKPGPKNALGELKILFPNKHAIYMHDTPSRGLFSRSARALSHGCVRLQNPRGMAAAVLGSSVSRVASKINLGTNNADELKVRIPVYIAYFTAWPNKENKIEYFGDIYSRDKHLGKAISKVSESRIKAG